MTPNREMEVWSPDEGSTFESVELGLTYISFAVAALVTILLDIRYQNDGYNTDVYLSFGIIALGIIRGAVLLFRRGGWRNRHILIIMPSIPAAIGMWLAVYIDQINPLRGAITISMLYGIGICMTPLGLRLPRLNTRLVVVFSIIFLVLALRSPHWQLISMALFGQIALVTVCRMIRVESKDFFDIVAAKQAEIAAQLALKEEKEKNACLARTCELTQIGNRRAFMELAAARVVEADRRNPIGIFIFDLNKFKQVNDTYGHEAGDRILQAAAISLRDTLGPEAIVARLGGDEFAAALPFPPGMRFARLTQDRFDKLVRMVEVDGKVLTFGWSMGGAVVPTHAKSLTEAMRLADAAAYASKVSGKAEVHNPLRNVSEAEQALA